MKNESAFHIRDSDGLVFSVYHGLRRRVKKEFVDEILVCRSYRVVNEEDHRVIFVTREYRKHISSDKLCLRRKVRRGYITRKINVFRLAFLGQLVFLTEHGARVGARVGEPAVKVGEAREFVDLATRVENSRQIRRVFNACAVKLCVRKIGVEYEQSVVRNGFLMVIVEVRRAVLVVDARLARVKTLIVYLEGTAVAVLVVGCVLDTDLHKYRGNVGSAPFLSRYHLSYGIGVINNGRSAVIDVVRIRRSELVVVSSSEYEMMGKGHFYGVTRDPCGIEGAAEEFKRNASHTRVTVERGDENCAVRHSFRYLFRKSAVTRSEERTAGSSVFKEGTRYSLKIVGVRILTRCLKEHPGAPDVRVVTEWRVVVDTLRISTRGEVMITHRDEVVVDSARAFLVPGRVFVEYRDSNGEIVAKELMLRAVTRNRALKLWRVSYLHLRVTRLAKTRELGRNVARANIRDGDHKLIFVVLGEKIVTPVVYLCRAVDRTSELTALVTVYPTELKRLQIILHSEDSLIAVFLVTREKISESLCLDYRKTLFIYVMEADSARFVLIRGFENSVKLFVRLFYQGLVEVYRLFGARINVGADELEGVLVYVEPRMLTDRGIKLRRAPVRVGHYGEVKGDVV